MIVSINWLKELVKLNKSIDEVINLLPLRTIGVKEVTENSFELDMKGYNRADLLSLRGVAYEIAAISDSEVNFKELDPKDFVWEGKGLPSTPVGIMDDTLCPIYCIARISNLKVGPSPKEWVEKLEQSGMRSVNNVADITNLIMLEYGQPQHAFDASTIKDETLIVRDAKRGEKFTTLDNKERVLEPTDLVIADSEKAVGLAGVMGGKNSEITDETTAILLEAAIFNAQALRKTASRLNLPSEASKRFQHGLTKKRLLQSLDAAIRMYQEIGGKLEAINIAGVLEEQEPEVIVSQDQINSLIGVDTKPEFVKSSLEKLGFKVNLSSKNEWEIKPPYWRLDISIAEDIIEEIARMYGYETLPAQSLEGEEPQKIDQKLFNFIYDLKVALVNKGFSEIQTYSFYSTKVINSLKLETNGLIKVANPMSKETEFMRDNLWPNLLEKVADNLKNFNTAPIFEIGKVYISKEGSLPEEKYRLAVALSDDNQNTIAELQTLFQKVAQELKMNVVVDGTDMDSEEKELFHPVRFYKLTDGEQKIGQIAEVHPRITNRFGVEKRVAILEISIV